jgi:hypothetical protein
MPVLVVAPAFQLFNFMIPAPERHDLVRGRKQPARRSFPRLLWCNWTRQRERFHSVRRGASIYVNVLAAVLDGVYGAPQGGSIVLVVDVFRFVVIRRIFHDSSFSKISVTKSIRVIEFELEVAGKEVN